MSSTTEAAPTTDRRGLALIVAIVVLSFGALIPFLSREQLAMSFPDDGFYYFQIARHIGAGDGVTFDGLHRTNGFHPLWGWLLVPLFATVADEVLALRVVLLLQTLLVAAACATLYAKLGPRLGRWPAAAIALGVVGFPGAQAILRGGMESALVLFLLVSVWCSWLRVRADVTSGARSDLRAGISCALLFLARLEAGSALAVLLVLGWRRYLASPRRACALVLPPVLTLAAYLVSNRLYFETWLPVSGIIKTAFARGGSFGSKAWVLFDLPWLGQTMVQFVFGRMNLQALDGRGLLAYALVVAATAAALVHSRSSVLAAARRAEAWSIGLISALLIALDKLTIGHLGPWQQVGFLILNGLLLGLAATDRPRVARLVVGIAVFGCLVRPAHQARVVGDPSTHFSTYRLQAVDWLQANTSEDIRIGSWNAGKLGYFAGRTVVNLDGLVNDIHYLRHVSGGGSIDEYLRREGIEWLADKTCEADPSPAVFLARTRERQLADQFERVAHFYRPETATQCPGYAVWRRRPTPEPG